MANKYRLKFTLSNGNTIDAGEIVVPEGAKGDKGDPYTLTSTDKAAIVQDVLAALPYYDGSVTISGGVELISFTIDGNTYEAEDGMTWAEWCDSSYNTGYWFAANNRITKDELGTLFIIKDVTPTQVIQSDYSYSVIQTGGSNN